MNPAKTPSQNTAEVPKWRKQYEDTKKDFSWFCCMVTGGCIPNNEVNWFRLELASKQQEHYPDNVYEVVLEWFEQVVVEVADEYMGCNRQSNPWASPEVVATFMSDVMDRCDNREVSYPKGWLKVASNLRRAIRKGRSGQNGVR